MRVFRNPPKMNWESLLERPKISAMELESHVRLVLDAVKKDGDKALVKYSKEFDKVELSAFEVTEAEIQEAVAAVEPSLKDAILLAKKNIETFHKKQVPAVEVVETMPGIRCWRKSLPIEKVGLYIPGGTAPLFSTILMLGIPASIAGCKEIILCSPPGADGKLHPAILYTAQLVGIHRVFKVGGSQAIAAMAFGTDQVPRVYKIFGPGNQYVTCAKQYVQQSGVAIDMPAGPSEVAIFADETADIRYLAADLLSQAEHGIDSQVILVSTAASVVDSIEEEVNRQLELLPRKELTAKALQHSMVFLLDMKEDAMEMLNAYAPEHLILNCAHALTLAEQVSNAGSVFIGPYSPESIGDYASGTNHTLPTNGHAKAYSGVSIDSFIKKITFQELTPQGLGNIGPAVEIMAHAEGLDAHKEAVSVRLADIPTLTQIKSNPWPSI
ncbi:MAG TPA: histidinol dehydrogenase [Flavitalea sp.]|nr:histidinol dehydrogenase [Flavitalea sp.]